MDTTMMYMQMAANALTHIEPLDPSTTRVLRQVIDFLVSDARLRPEEFDA